MVDFLGTAAPLPQSISRGTGTYGDPVPETVVQHAEGYEEVLSALPDTSTPQELTAEIEATSLPLYPLAIYCGNWLIAFKGGGHWLHIQEGRPEVLLEGVGAVDMVEVTQQAVKGDGQVFCAIAQS